MAEYLIFDLIFFFIFFLQFKILAFSPVFFLIFILNIITFLCISRVIRIVKIKDGTLL